MTNKLPIGLSDIRTAAKAIAGAVVRTPCVASKTLSRLTGADVRVKFENLQFTASFKERGALNKLLSLDAEQRKRGVIAMSAGNHAQGVASSAPAMRWAAARMSSRVTMASLGNYSNLGRP